MQEALSTPFDTRMTVVQGDITRLSVDAVVNAANESLLGGGGVDGAIHRAAGPELLEHCRKLGGCPTGGARITPGFRMAARHIIHTVGPVWQGGEADEDALLASCYRSSLALAEENGARTLAFPAISTGAYSFPADRAVKIAIKTVTDCLSGTEAIDLVVFCCFDSRTTALYEAAFEARKDRGPESGSGANRKNS